MTPQELQAAARISAVMRAARKGKALTQIFVSQRLGVSQSALSKMESGYLIPSAPQWFEFCSLTEIAPESLTTGYIDRKTVAELQSFPNGGGGMKIPRKYLENRGSKVRALLPLLSFFRDVAGEEKVTDYFRLLKMDPDLFTDLDQQVSLGFFLDLSRHLISSGLLKPEDLPKLAGYSANPGNHGDLRKDYDQAPDWTRRVSTLIANSKLYECNFKYAIEEVSNRSVTVSITPEAHLKDFHYKDDPVLGDFLCRFKKQYFENFTGYAGSPKAELRELECHYRGGAHRCVYQLTQATG